MERLIVSALPWTLAVVGLMLGYLWGRRMTEQVTSSRRDTITGLPDKQALLDALRGQLALQRRYHTPFALCLFEALAASRTRDVTGAEQDEQWQAVAATLEACSRETELVCRFAESQFAVVLPQTALEGATVYAERALETLAAKLRVSANAAVTAVLDGDTRESLLDRLDQALLLARATGAGQIFQHTGLEARPAESTTRVETSQLAAGHIERADSPAAKHAGGAPDSAALNPAIWGSHAPATSEAPLPSR